MGTLQVGSGDEVAGDLVVSETLVPSSSVAIVHEAGARPVASRSPERVYLATLAPAGRRSMAARLHAVALLLGSRDLHGVPWERLRYEHVAAIRARLAESGLAPASVNTTLAALRGVAREAWHLGYLTAEEHARIRGVKPVRGSRLPAGRSASQDELAALLRACEADPTPAGRRDAALLALLYAAGLRREEVATIDLADADLARAQLRVRHGKGGKERRVPLASWVADALAGWVDVRGQAPGRLFVPINKSGRLAGQSLTAQAVYNALKKRTVEAGLTESLSPHDLRRTFVGDLLDAGADIATVQQLAGHANVSTTARYDRRGDAAKEAAVALLRLPGSEEAE